MGRIELIRPLLFLCNSIPEVDNDIPYIKKQKNLLDIFIRPRGGLLNFYS